MLVYWNHLLTQSCACEGHHDGEKPSSQTTHYDSLGKLHDSVFNSVGFSNPDSEIKYIDLHVLYMCIFRKGEGLMEQVSFCLRHHSTVIRVIPPLLRLPASVLEMALQSSSASLCWSVLEFCVVSEVGNDSYISHWHIGAPCQRELFQAPGSIIPPLLLAQNGHICFHKCCFFFLLFPTNFGSQIPGLWNIGMH